MLEHSESGNVALLEADLVGGDDAVAILVVPGAVSIMLNNAFLVTYCLNQLT